MPGTQASTRGLSRQWPRQLAARAGGCWWAAAGDCGAVEALAAPEQAKRTRPILQRGSSRRPYKVTQGAQGHTARRGPSGTERDSLAQGQFSLSIRWGGLAGPHLGSTLFPIFRHPEIPAQGLTLAPTSMICCWDVHFPSTADLPRRPQGKRETDSSQAKP